ncbi:MAG TPA: hypothetical protein VF116_20490 [Ktedonobacterales bacterium]
MATTAARGLGRPRPRVSGAAATAQAETMAATLASVAADRGPVVGATAGVICPIRSTIPARLTYCAATATG